MIIGMQEIVDDLEKMSLDELVELATIKLDAVEKLPDEKKRPFSKLIDGIKFFLLGIPSVLLYRAIEDFVFETNWEDVLRSVVDLLQSILRI